jgi:asparagine synthase (glutamine-hydrolysing)
MCGIAGYWNLGSGRPVDPGVIRVMIATLTHRGPDEEGTWQEGELALGIRRLRVVDLEGGRQPMSNEDGTVQVVFNGEIYGHRELRRELEGRGHRFRTDSDTEILAHGWEEWGPDLPRHLNGMFALAVRDTRRNTLFLARDRLGIKPLYLWRGEEGVVFGSELKAVLAAPWVPLEWDLEAVDDFMTYEYVPAPRSIVRGVEKLLPGERLLFRGDRPQGVERDRYWTLEADPDREATLRRRGPAAAAGELRERLGVAVRRRMLADVPLGAFLSGGIDSSAIVGLMTEAAGGVGSGTGPVRTFSLGFADRSYDERAHARRVAENFRTTHTEQEVTPQVGELAERIHHHLDEPFGDVSAFPTYLLSGLTRERVTVALSGDGGDELFAGYDHYRAHRWAHRLRGVARSRGWAAVDHLLDRLPPDSRKKGPVNLAKRFAEGFRRPSDLEHARWWIFQDLGERRAIYGPDLRDTLVGRDPFAYYRRRLEEGGRQGFRGLQRQLYSDVTGYLPDDILTKVDRMSMAVSLEARVPFLDHELVEYAMALPDDWKLRGATTKWILRRAMDGFLPRETLRRGKQGFSMPMKNWLKGPLRPMLEELAPAVRERGWFDGAEVERLVGEHLAGRANRAHRLWCLMSLELSLAHLGGPRTRVRA